MFLGQQSCRATCFMSPLVIISVECFDTKLAFVFFNLANITTMNSFHMPLQGFMSIKLFFTMVSLELVEELRSSVMHVQLLLK